MEQVKERSRVRDDWNETLDDRSWDNALHTSIHLANVPRLCAAKARDKDLRGKSGPMQEFAKGTILRETKKIGSTTLIRVYVDCHVGEKVCMY